MHKLPLLPPARCVLNSIMWSGTSSSRTDLGLLAYKTRQPGGEGPKRSPYRPLLHRRGGVYQAELLRLSWSASCNRCLGKGPMGFFFHTDLAFGALREKWGYETLGGTRHHCAAQWEVPCCLWDTNCGSCGFSQLSPSKVPLVQRAILELNWCLKPGAE